MPYEIRKQGSQWCVYKQSGGPSLGCHSSRAKAARQIAAIEANEASAKEETQMDTTAHGTNAMWVFSGPAGETFAVQSSSTSPEEERRGEPWDGVLATIMSPTSDGRIIEPEMGWRDLPVPFSVQVKTAEGHEGSEACGRIEGIELIPIEKFARASEFDLDEVREGALVVYGWGTLDGSEASQEAKRLLSNGAGVSLDGLHFTGRLWNSEDLSEIDTSEMSLEDIFEGIMSMEFLRGMTGKVAGVTVVNVPAFEEATVMIASSGTMPSRLRFGLATMTASAAGLAPLEPPKDWFYTEEPYEPVPLTIDEDGRVYGHLALWDQCHASFASCERPPRSLADYAFFHTGQLKTAEGDLINVGRITVGDAGGIQGGHASIVLGRKGAIEHYDKTGCVGAFVRAVDGRLGIWLSGAVRSDAPAERVRDMRANPLSGDWRDYELVAALSVTCGGFPIPRAAEARMVASAGGEQEVAVLIASAYTSPVFEITGEVEDQDGEKIGVSLSPDPVGWTFPCDGEPIDFLTYKRTMRELSERMRAALEQPDEAA